jgi:hypothetical protein
VAEIEVKVGQVWADNDKRSEGRHVRVVAIERLHRRAVVRRCSSTGEFTGAQVTRIRLERFKPTSTGYRLVSDPENVEGGG